MIELRCIRFLIFTYCCKSSRILFFVHPDLIISSQEMFKSALNVQICLSGKACIQGY